jgi:hypothetical protein
MKTFLLTQIQKKFCAKVVPQFCTHAICSCIKKTVAKNKLFCFFELSEQKLKKIKLKTKTLSNSPDSMVKRLTSSIIEKAKVFL